MVDLRRVIGVVQISIGIILILATVYFSNVFAISHSNFTKDASAHFQDLQEQGIANNEPVPEYATVHANYILLSNMYLMMLINVGISTLLVLLAIMMILQGIVNKFAITKLSIGYKPMVWLGLIGLVVFLIILLLTQYFMQYFA